MGAFRYMFNDALHLTWKSHSHAVISKKIWLLSTEKIRAEHPKYFPIFAHGQGISLEDPNNSDYNIFPHEGDIVELLLEAGWEKGQLIISFACQSGKTFHYPNDPSESFAQTLSNTLNINVIAPTEDFITQTASWWGTRAYGYVDNGGRMKPFSPKK